MDRTDTRPVNEESREERELFLEALEYPDGHQRVAFLESACKGRFVLRHGVEALLTAHGRAPEDFLASPVTFPENTDSEFGFADGSPLIATGSAAPVQRNLAPGPLGGIALPGAGNALAR